MIVIYEGTNIHTVSAGAEHKQRFVPGRNAVPDETWAALKEKSAGTKDLIARHLLKEVEAELEDGSSVTLTDIESINIGVMTPASALQLIENETEVQQLRQYAIQEQQRNDGGRAEIYEAIEKQVGLVDPLKEQPVEDEVDGGGAPAEATNENAGGEADGAEGPDDQQPQAGAAGGGDPEQGSPGSTLSDHDDLEKPPPNRQEAILWATRKILKANQPQTIGEDNKPIVRAMEILLGYQITEPERNDAYREFMESLRH